MTNRILDAYVTTHHADPASAELRIVVRPEAITPTTEIKGRLMGPRSEFASTVEIAYPYRELARTDHLLLRVLIPEPSFWEPTTPLLYEGPLELWQDGERVEQIRLRHGIRAVQLGPRGLRVNSRPFQLQGICATTLNEIEARRARDADINAIVLPATDDTVNLLRISDRFGLFVLGRVEAPDQWPRWALACHRHPSYLGCVLTAGVGAVAMDATVAGLVGAEVSADGKAPVGQFDFVLIDAEAKTLADLPALLKIAPAAAAPGAREQLIGWVRRAP